MNPPWFRSDRPGFSSRPLQCESRALTRPASTSTVATGDGGSAAGENTHKHEPGWAAVSASLCATRSFVWGLDGTECLPRSVSENENMPWVPPCHFQSLT